ncbi:hypothetical protein [Pantoea allii]|uniref:hypothetical protein n=1 Tax=Pantoea allii TaxID=574096 RepID=UPI001301B708|nr:hypothetical protein [Pantoea allii]MBW1252295.1 hypothetical protein [Pantoea allii]MBW1261574.1 hypothetical protein [Pantoea allii]MBW1283766.1 hypothetical protein [Pantoea allii]
MLSANAPARNNRQKEPVSVAAKYQYESHGQVMQWSGRGRLPLDLEQMLLNGTRLASLLITHTQEDEDKAKNRQIKLFVQKGKNPELLKAPLGGFKPVSNTIPSAATEKAKEAVKPAPTAAKGMFAYEDGAVKLHTWNGKKAMPRHFRIWLKAVRRFLTDANIAQAREIEHKLLKD